MFASLVVVYVDGNVHPAGGCIKMVGPVALGVLGLDVEGLPRQNFLVLIRSVQVKDENAVFFHKVGRFADGFFKPIRRADMVVGVKGGDRRADGAVQVQRE